MMIKVYFASVSRDKYLHAMIAVTPFMAIWIVIYLLYNTGTTAAPVIPRHARILYIYGKAYGVIHLVEMTNEAITCMQIIII